MSGDGNTHRALGVVEEINVGIDEGDDGYARVVIVDTSGDTVSALIPKDVAHDTALELSKNVVDWRDVDAETVKKGGRVESSGTFVKRGPSEKEAATRLAEFDESGRRGAGNVQDGDADE